MGGQLHPLGRGSHPVVDDPNPGALSKRRRLLTVDDVSEPTLPFGPGTVSWDVLRRPVFLLGGMNALLLQLAEPKVAAGVAEHSDFSNRIFDRLRHTVELMMEVGLGEPSQAEQALDEMDRAHEGVRGSLPDGSSYDAEDPELRLWVLATLISTVISVERRYVGEFDDEDRGRYYQESMAVARALRVGDPPPDLVAFRAYMDRRTASLEVGEQARRIAGHVLYPRMGWAPPWVFAPLRVVTADLLPARLRHGYGLHMSAAQRRWLRRAQSLSRVIIPRLPNWIRTFPVLRPVSGVRDRIVNRSGNDGFSRPR